MLRGTSAVLLVLVLAGCSTTDSVPTVDLAIAALASADGKPVGTAAVSRHASATIVSVTVTGAPGAVHGLHLHTVGKCESPFTSAGPHLNPGGHQHGKDSPLGAHLGDLPNVTIDKAGFGSVSIGLAGDAASIEAALFDADGTSIVLHAAADDYRSDPTGNSGARIACGVLKQT